MKRETLHERVYAIKYLLSTGELKESDLSDSIIRDLERVKTSRDGIVEEESVSDELRSLVEKTLDVEH
ncbi:hypothetical protein N781_11785 [Pontibacillus halophilus JSM 076056 = DSM 19796]|uniref:Uncharacterized protein n=1 Tax=Pontibacillus halophilus JSM 076056 = DSM 19796 TaxID=1385510 RepID=A0A0A5IBV2_9BACI|nr:hypothetical protein [Pontibacillus halophilus]KGX93322.1 hypothetical protein N781_11785 [Pontibacillus halophilus JSM 076056 = DSM 19796]